MPGPMPARFHCCTQNSGRAALQVIDEQRPSVHAAPISPVLPAVPVVLFDVQRPGERGGRGARLADRIAREQPAECAGMCGAGDEDQARAEIGVERHLVGRVAGQVIRRIGPVPATGGGAEPCDRDASVPPPHGPMMPREARPDRAGFAPLAPSSPR